MRVRGLGYSQIRTQRKRHDSRNLFTGLMGEVDDGHTSVQCLDKEVRNRHDVNVMK